MFRNTRNFQHNLNTGISSSMMTRAYGVPTSWTPPAAKGVRMPNTRTIVQMEYPTISSSGNPRNDGSWAFNPYTKYHTRTIFQ